MDIDHHLQQTIIERLKQSTDPVRYTDLKDPTLENSLFSYHLNKLITRNMVQKTDDGYALTIEGARWLNDNGFLLKPKEAPRVFIALVVQNNDGKYLINQRSGQMKSAINDYMFATTVYSNDAAISDQIQAAITKHIPDGKLVERTEFGFVQIQPVYIDNRTMRSLVSVTRCQVEPFEPPLETQRWMSRDEINAIDHPSAEILRQIIDYTQNSSAAHDTPSFAS